MKEEVIDKNVTGKKKNNKIIIIISIIVVIIVIVVLGFVLLNKKTSDTNKESNSSTTIEKRTGKKLKIYKSTYEKDESVVEYDFEEDATDAEEYVKELYATITCKTNECVPKGAHENYAIIEEADGAYLIDVKTDELVYGPFGIEMKEEENGYDYDEDDKYHFLYDYVLEDNVRVTAIVISRNNKSTVFIPTTRKEYNNLEGSLYNSIGIDPNKAIDYGYIILNNIVYEDDYPDAKESLVYDLSNGKLLSKYDNIIDTFIFNNKVYILYDNRKDIMDYFIYNIKDVNGKDLFNKEYLIVNAENKNLVLADKNYFYVYDNNLKLIKQSNKYNNIIMIGKDFVLVDNNKELQLLDLNDTLLTTFVKNYNENKYYVHTMLSGWFTENGKNGIYIVVGQDNVNINEVLKNNPDMDKESLEGMDLGYEYYYIPKTKETGKIATYIGGYAKPILYLYPTKTTKVQVGFKYPSLLTTTYPKFNKYWNVTVDKNGSMTDSQGKHYYALYWEEISNKRVSFDEGFYVESEYAIKFLEEKLDIIGLNEREANEFIMYWLPILEKNKKSLVYFELTEERESFNKLLISPKPDSLLRIAVHIKRVDKKVNIKEQKLTHFNRKGFSAIEWGGYSY